MQPARYGLNKIVRDALRRAPEQEGPLFAWPLVCGSAVATRTQAESFEKAVLRIIVPDATWRAQLQDLAPQYLAALQSMVAAKVERIEFAVAQEPKRTRNSGVSQ
jgi:predicted nucleic acid-binding Zn ribbon protein